MGDVQVAQEEDVIVGRDSFTAKEMLIALKAFGHTTGRPEEVAQRDRLALEAWRGYIPGY